MNSLLNPTVAVDAETLAGRAAQQICTEQTYLFPQGVFAFEHVRQFVFICDPETSPFIFMQALDPAHLGFVCVDPFLICPGYQPRIRDADAALLELTTPAEALMLSIVNPAPDVRQTTANLQAPLVINLRTGQGRQIICDQQEYSMRYAIWAALEQSSADIAAQSPENEAKCSAA